MEINKTITSSYISSENCERYLNNVTKRIKRLEGRFFEEFEKAWKRRQSMKYQGQTFYVVCLDDLIRSKRAAGRDVDLEDVRLLELPDDQSTT